MPGSPRIAWLDIVKALGIFLVFYGHLLETLFRYGGRPFLLPQLTFIYAFHMPLFFVLSGFLYRDRELPFGRFFRYHFLTRLLPFFFFNLLALSALLVQQTGRGGIDWQVVGRGSLALLRGMPSFNMLTWFLACLFTVELIHFGVKRWLKTSSRMGMAIFLALMVGLPIARWAAQRLATTGVYFNVWYIQEALTAYAFYLTGIWMRHVGVLDKRPSQAHFGALGLSLLFLVVTWLTAGWNEGPFVTEPGLVLMSISSQGSFVWFPVTAVTGTLFLIFLAKLIPVNRVLLYFGQKTLILLGMGGLFFEFFNQPLVAVTTPYFPASPFAATIQAVALTLLSFVICVPFIHVFEKFVPQLVGKPGKVGPILPRLG
jgi:acyltransferase